MASLSRPTFATYVINEKVTIDTTDREDHTFCGVAFPVQCKTILPVDHIVINSISVRGALGPVTVWVTKENNDDNNVDGEGDAEMGTATRTRRHPSVRYNLRNRGGDEERFTSVKRGQMMMKEKYWDKVYDAFKKPSFRQYCSLDLSANPIILKPGEIRGIYVHSTMENDQAIVYDNRQSLKTHDDQFLTVLPGRAHVSTEVFGMRPIWGHGNSWRDNREFVGKISYGVVYKLWNPSEHLRFGGKFQALANILFMCQRRWESPMSMLSDDCIFYILNMCRWDWMEDSFDDLRVQKKKMNLLEASRAENANAGNNEDNEDQDTVVAGEENDLNGENDEDEVEVEMQDESEEQEVIANVNMEEASSYDSDYGGSDSDDGYEDHRGSSTFQYFYYDDTRSSDEEREVEDHNARQEQRRILWLRSHFGHHFGAQLIVGGGSDDSSDDSDYNEES